RWAWSGSSGHIPETPRQPGEGGKPGSETENGYLQSCLKQRLDDACGAEPADSTNLVEIRTVEGDRDDDRAWVASIGLTRGDRTEASGQEIQVHLFGGVDGEHRIQTGHHVDHTVETSRPHRLGQGARHLGGPGSEHQGSVSKA